jgi:hypothetical protein
MQFINVTNEPSKINYMSLCKDLPSKDLTPDQKKYLLQRVSLFTQSEMNTVFSFITMYANEHGDNTQVPYKGERNDPDVVYNLMNLPTQLRHILYKYAVIQHDNEN